MVLVSLYNRVKPLIWLVNQCGKSTVALGAEWDLGANGRIVGGSIKFSGATE